MKPETSSTFRALALDEIGLVSGGEAPPIQGGGLPKPILSETPPIQGGGLPKPILSGKPPAPPLPGFDDLP